MIFHNTFYADVYSANDQRWGWGTVIRELLQLRYAVTDRAGVFVSDEIFLGVLEDGDTSGLKKADGSAAGYTPIGYWKQGLRYNRSYLGFDYKVTPNLTVAPSYMIEIGLEPHGFDGRHGHRAHPVHGGDDLRRDLRPTQEVGAIHESPVQAIHSFRVSITRLALPSLMGRAPGGTSSTLGLVRISARRRAVISSCKA